MPKLPELALLLALSASLAGCQTPPSAPEPPPPAPVCPEPPPAPEVDALKAVLGHVEELRRALQHSQGRGAAELLQSGVQLDAFAASTDAQAEALKPLAALLAARLAEQRRLQDSVERLTLQLRDSQRRHDQLAEKLEALKAIEQTLPAKPGTAPR
jgi:hypothetical protein